MDVTVTRQRLVSAFVAALAGLGATMAHGLPPSASSLEQQAQAEFAKAGVAVRERLECEAMDDPIGARIAEHDAELRRYRYLDLKRELDRLHRQPAASPSVAAPRDPFVPDGAFLADSARSTTRTVPKTANSREEGASHRAWDMYRPRIAMEGAETRGPESSPVMRATPAATAMGQAKDMYAAAAVTPAQSDRRTPGQELEVPALSGGEAAQQPFLVYREGLARSDRRE